MENTEQILQYHKTTLCHVEEVI